MKTRWLLMSGGLIFLLSIAAQVGFASGTPAGTAITNQAQVQYQAGTNTRTTLSNTTTLYVAHRVAGSFTPASGTGSGVDNRTVYFATVFVNQGNRADNFNFSFNANAGYTVDMLLDADNSGSFTAGDNPIASTGNLAADAQIGLLVRVQIAASRPDNEAVTITATLTSTAADDGGSNIVVANPGAAFQYSVIYTVKRPVIAFTATSDDVTTNASRIPGANITYALSLQNTGSGDVSGNSTVTFVLDPHFHFVSANNSGALSGADPGTGNGGTVTWTFAPALMTAGHLANAFEVVVQVEQVTNNGTGAAAGTTLYAMTTGQGTQTKVDFNDGVNNYSQDNANSFSFAVGTASGAVITQVTPDGTGEPGNTVEYQYTLKNTGNATDGFALSQANSAGSNLDVAHVFSLASGGAAITSLAGVTQGQTVTFHVRVTVPGAATDGQTIIRDLTATTQTADATPPTGGSISSTDVLSTTTRAAVVAIAVAAPEIVSGGVAGHTVPGTVLRYTVTVTNTGSAPASQISASNVNPHAGSNLVVETSVNIDANGDGDYELAGVALPYTPGTGVEALFSGGVLTVKYPSVAAGGYVKYQYDVTVQ